MPLSVCFDEGDEISRKAQRNTKIQIDIGKIDAPIDLSQMMSRQNEDQKRIFDRLYQILQNKNQILRLYISGENNTGKNFLIEMIKHWTRIHLKKSICSHGYRSI